MPDAREHTAKEAEYRSHAQRLRTIAGETKNTRERETLLRQASAWTELADRMKKLSENDG